MLCMCTLFSFLLRLGNVHIPDKAPENNEHNLNEIAPTEAGETSEYDSTFVKIMKCWQCFFISIFRFFRTRDVLSSIWGKPKSSSGISSEEENLSLNRASPHQRLIYETLISLRADIQVVKDDIAKIKATIAVIWNFLKGSVNPIGKS